MQKYSPVPLSYDELSNFEMLYKSHRVARLSKSHKDDVIKFEHNLFENLCQIEEQLKNKTYAVKNYRTFEIFEPKRREIQALEYHDRIVQHTICDNYLTPFYKKRLILTNCACQEGKGTTFARQKLKQFFVDFYKHYKKNGYILKCDIKKYFASINHNILKSQLYKIPDKDVRNLIFKIIDSYNFDTKKGLPIGNQVSQILGVTFLDKLDRLIKEKLHIKYYVRYMDDFILIHNDKNYLKYCLVQITNCLNNLDLMLNDKTHIFPVKNGVEFLGGRYLVQDSGKIIIKLKKQSKQRLKNRLKQITKLYCKGKIDNEFIKGSLAGYKGHLKRLNARKFYYENVKKLKNIIK